MASLPLFCQKENDLPWSSCFHKLREAWLAAQPGRQSRDLAEHLSTLHDQKVTPQRISQWASVSDSRTVPLYILLTLCEELGCYLEVHPDRLEVVPQSEAA